MRILIFSLALLMALPAAARDVYKWVNEEGVIIYSDTFRADAERIKVDDAKFSRSIAQGEAAASGAASADASAAAVEYKEFAISQPDNDETIRSNEGIVTVGLTLSPSLLPGHGIQVLVDGNPVGDKTLSTTQFTLNDMNRGTHSLQAKVVDESGATLISTETINIHLRKASIIQP